MILGQENRIRRFRIGVVHTALSSSLRSLNREYASLYGAFESGVEDKNEIRIEVTRQPLSLRHRRRYVVTINGRIQYEPGRRDEVLPYLEWATAWELAQVMPQFLQLHASSMELDGAGIILPGDSGNGKSTLTAGLLTRGWRYLCDEFALVHTDSLMLHPYPRAICIKKSSFPVIESLGLSFHGGRHYVKGFKGPVAFVNPIDVYPNAIGRVCPIRYVIFPKYVAGATPALTPISRGAAAFDLHRVCFNLFGCRALGLDVIASMIRGTTCYRLTSGEINATCDLLEDVVRCGRHRRVRIA